MDSVKVEWLAHVIPMWLGLYLIVSKSMSQYASLEYFDFWKAYLVTIWNQYYVRWASLVDLTAADLSGGLHCRTVARQNDNTILTVWKANFNWIYWKLTTK